MQSKNNCFSFREFTENLRDNLVQKRAFETKLGEKIQLSSEFNSEKKYVLLGVQEDIGPQANLGFPGAKQAFDAFLPRFLNIQSNRFLSGDNIFIAGSVIQLEPFVDVEKARELVNELDAFLLAILTPYLQKGFIPILIGGGHNNAFPLIQACALQSNLPFGVINCDPHADYRVLEGRHSGNPFSTAKNQQFLSKYAAVGLHQSYNSEEMLQRMDADGVVYSFLDDYIENNPRFEAEIEKALTFLGPEKYGIELDMDSICYMPSSAFTPSGISLEQARRYVQLTAASAQVSYIHFPESAPNSLMEEKIVGKALAYLVSDFIKMNQRYAR